MTVTYSTAAKNDRLDALTALIDGGAGAGKLEIGTAAMASVLAIFTLNDPAAAAAAAAVLTISGLPKTVTAAATGEAAEARIVDSNDVVVVSGLTVDTAAADIIIDNTTITVSQDVNLNSGTITHAA